MWSIGTIVVELVLRVPFLAGDSDIDQLKKTFHALGSPTEQEWPVSTVFLTICWFPWHGISSSHTQGHTKLPDYHEISGYPKNPWWNLVASLGKDGQDLCRELLKLDPMKRPTAKKALYHRFFTQPPRPTPPILLPKPAAELRPRQLAPQDLAGMAPAGTGTKRKDPPESPSGKENARSVARRLFV